MLTTVFLNSSPVGVLTNPRMNPESEACRKWLKGLQDAGVEIVLPEIIDYEIRRELLRAGKVRGIRLLDQLKANVTFLPLTSSAMLLAADLWARARQQGTPTAPPDALDADVILAAQALDFGLPPADFVIATSNQRHLTQFVPADEWKNINP